MNKLFKPLSNSSVSFLILLLIFLISSCAQNPREVEKRFEISKQTDTPEYYQLRPELEKMYGYTQAVKVGNLLKVGGVISIDDQGKPLGIGDYQQQMKNCYQSLEKVLTKYGCSFDDVIVENIFTTNMSALQQNASYRHEIYKQHFPTGSWIGIKELGLPEMMIEIEIEAIIPNASTKIKD